MNEKGGLSGNYVLLCGVDDESLQNRDKAHIIITVVS